MYQTILVADDEYMAEIIRDRSVVVTRVAQEVEFFPNEKDAGAWIQHVYGLKPHEAKQIGIEIRPIKNRGPQPGDAVVTNAYYACDKDKETGENIDTYLVLQSWYSGGSSMMACFKASAYRDGDHVSCSGGPLPQVSPANLKFVGLRNTRFWRWGDGYAGASKGGEYWVTVPLWRWDGQPPT